MNKKALLIVSLTVLIPLVCYFLVKSYGEEAVIIPRHYLPDTVISRVENGKAVDDTVWHKVANIRLVNQLGDTVNLYDIKDRVIVMDFFFTSCGSICPSLTHNMAKLQQSFLKGGDAMRQPEPSIVQFVSFTVDPERDSVSRLRDYADRFGVNHDNWWMLTGSKDSIYNFAFEQLKVDKLSGEKIDPDFVHTSRFILVDKNYYVRGYYNGLDSVSLGQLAKDIGIMMLSKDDNPEDSAFDPVLLLVFLVLAAFLAIAGTGLLFKKSKIK